MSDPVSTSDADDLKALYHDLARQRAREAKDELSQVSTDRALAQSARALEDAAGSLGFLAELLDGQDACRNLRAMAAGITGAAADCEFAADVSRQAARG
jgi:hypothetical protein